MLLILLRTLSQFSEQVAEEASAKRNQLVRRRLKFVEHLKVLFEVAELVFENSPVKSVLVVLGSSVFSAQEVHVMRFSQIDMQCGDVTTAQMAAIKRKVARHAYLEHEQLHMSAGKPSRIHILFKIDTSQLVHDLIPKPGFSLEMMKTSCTGLHIIGVSNSGIEENTMVVSDVDSDSGSWFVWPQLLKGTL